MGLNPIAMKVRGEIGLNGGIVGIPWGPGSKAGIAATVKGGMRHSIVLPPSSTEGAFEIAIADAMQAPSAELLSIGGGLVDNVGMAEIGARYGLPCMASTRFNRAVAEVCAREGILYLGNINPKDPIALAEVVEWQLENAPADGENRPFVSFFPFKPGDHVHVATNIQRFGRDPGVHFIAVGELSTEGAREGSLTHTMGQPFFKAAVLRLHAPSDEVASTNAVRTFNDVIRRVAMTT